MAFRNIPPNGFPAIPDIEDLEAVVKDVGTLKTTTAGLAEDVSDLEEQKANQITIALPFNPETEYEVGDLVYYNGLTYRCTNAHTGEWDADDFAGTTIANELATLKNGLIGHSQTSGAPVDVDGTLQLNENVLSHGLILISMGRYSYESTFVAFKSRIEADAYSHATLYIDGTRNVSFTLSTTGLLTITATSTPVNITVWGVL